MIFANLFGMGGPDIWIVAGVVVLLFGGSKLPTLMRSFGEGMKEFKKATRDMHDDPADQANASVVTTAEPPRALDTAPRVSEPTATITTTKE